MAIRMRRGLLDELDESKLLAGEWAVTIDPETNRQKVLMCFGAGIVKQMGTYNDFQQMIEEIADDLLEDFKEEIQPIKTEIEQMASDVSADKDAVIIIQSNITDVLLPQIQQCVEEAQTAQGLAEKAKEDAEGEVVKAKRYSEDAEGYSEDSKDYADLSKSYAVGTGGEVRPDDATENAKYYYEQTKAISGGNFIPNSEKGIAGGVATLGSDGKVPESQLPTIATDAEHITYDNTTSELESENVQSAIDELKEDLVSVADDVLNLKMVGYTIPKELKVQNYVDSNGVFHQKINRINLGDLEYTHTSAPYISFVYDANVYGIFCFTRKYVQASPPMPDFGALININHALLIYDSSIASVSDFKNENNGNYLYYELETEITMSVDGNEYTPKWELIGSVVGANSVAIDSTKYSEFYALVKRTSQAESFEYLINSKSLSSEIKAFKNGYYESSSSYSYIGIHATNTNIKLSSYLSNGTDILSSTTMTVYGRR